MRVNLYKIYTWSWSLNPHFFGGTILFKKCTENIETNHNEDLVELRKTLPSILFRLKLNNIGIN